MKNQTKKTVHLIAKNIIGSAVISFIAALVINFVVIQSIEDFNAGKVCWSFNWFWISNAVVTTTIIYNILFLTLYYGVWIKIDQYEDLTVTTIIASVLGLGCIITTQLWLGGYQNAGQIALSKVGYYVFIAAIIMTCCYGLFAKSYIQGVAFVIIFSGIVGVMRSFQFVHPDHSLLLACVLGAFFMGAQLARVVYRYLYVTKHDFLEEEKK